MHCLHSAVPAQVSGVRFVPSDKGYLSLEWSKPQSDVSNLYYEIRFRHYSDPSSWQGPINATKESVTLQIRLKSSAPYGVQVRAVSEIGAGPYSSEETVKCLFPHTHMHVHTRTHVTRTHTRHTHTSHMHTYTYTIHPSIHSFATELREQH